MEGNIALNMSLGVILYVISLLMAFFVWAPGSIKEVLGLSYFWQLKEYRIDRFRDFLSTTKGRSLIFSSSNLVRIILIAVLFISNTTLLLYAFIALGVYNIAFLMYSALNKRLFRPKRTFRMIIVLALVFAIEIASIIVFFDEFVRVVLILQIVRPLLISVIILLVGIPFIFAKKRIIKKATKKMKSMKDLKVIGITGSYGKSSTKEFLFDILKKEFNVVKTPKNINVDIGVARIVLSDIKEDTDVFIVEMGAYKKKEIDNICKIVSPEIGILTGINEQHLSLFGSIENTIKAKGELLADLPKDGIAIVNYDNENCHKAMKLSGAEKVIKYGTEGSPDVKATGIRQEGSTLHFNVHLGDEEHKFEVGLLGKHYVQNLLGVIICAHELGLSLGEIAEYAKSCRVTEQSLELFEGKDGVRILDDSYNSNPDGFIAALKTAKSLDPKRLILVTMGMLELGKDSKKLHEKVGKEIKKMCDKVFVTTLDAHRNFGEVVEDLVLSEDHNELLKLLKKEVKKGDLILFENRVQKSVLDYFKK